VRGESGQRHEAGASQSATLTGEVASRGSMRSEMDPLTRQGSSKVPRTMIKTLRFPFAPPLLALVTALVTGSGCGAGTTPTASAPSSTTSSTPAAGASDTASATSAAPVVTPEIQAIVDAPDRSPEDRALDAGRHPAELLAFAGIKPGMHVAELSAGGGYTTELLARAVGPTGVVYGENTKFVLDRFAEKPWSERLTKPVMQNVKRVDREIDDPLPPDVHDLDAVVYVLFYHDSVWLKADRDKMNRAVFAALKPGGRYIIVDHSGRPGTGVTESQTLHRIEEQVVRDEVTRAGFQLSSEGSFLRNPSDTRDWNASPMAAGERRGTSDRFALAFIKPAS
jgi:predicted methyltransferase